MAVPFIRSVAREVACPRHVRMRVAARLSLAQPYCAQFALLDKLLREGVDDALRGGENGDTGGASPAEDRASRSGWYLLTHGSNTRISALDGRASHNR
jgi:hypothetical protein